MSHYSSDYEFEEELIRSKVKKQLQNLKLCINCRHYQEVAHTHWCVNPINGIDLVTGKVGRQLASIVRETDSLCGTQADWFQQKVTKQKSWKIW